MSNDLKNFVLKINEILLKDKEFTIESARKTVKEINEFLYTTYEGIGSVETLGEHRQFLSEFHRYWNANYKEILDVKINDEMCEKVADELYTVYKVSNGKAFSEVYDKNGLDNKEVCRVRLLTANQDFRGSRSFEELSNIYKSDCSIFDERIISNNPEEFLRNIRVSGLSQSDKRIQFAKEISEMLIEHGCSPYELIDYYGRDIYALRNALINRNGAGYGNKKADMFVRDMVVMGVWENVSNFDKIDVASDVNTIKIALRTGIIKTAIPLVSSFLDIFCNQYSYIDEMSAKAWRRVWEMFVRKYPNTDIISPCLFDYFVYNVVGKEFCKYNLYLFKGDICEHTFLWHSNRNKTCQICYKEKGERKKASVLNKMYMCEDDNSIVAMKETKFYKKNICMPNLKKCPFTDVCKKNGTIKLKPPKSISILGRTGWADAYTNKGEGGGGLMA